MCKYWKEREAFPRGTEEYCTLLKRKCACCGDRDQCAVSAPLRVAYEEAAENGTPDSETDGPTAAGCS